MKATEARSIAAKVPKKQVDQKARAERRTARIKKDARAKATLKAKETKRINELLKPIPERIAKAASSGRYQVATHRIMQCTDTSKMVSTLEKLGYTLTVKEITWPEHDPDMGYWPGTVQYTVSWKCQKTKSTKR